MKRSTFMIQDYPQLVKYFASRNPVHLLLFVIPLFCFFVFHAAQAPFSTILLGVVAGILYWTFLEYAIHRWLYHSNYPANFIRYFLGSFHLYHHADMTDHRVLNAGFLMVYVVTPLILSPLLLLTRDYALLAAVGAGLSMAHYFYEWVHYVLHYKHHERGYLAYIQNYHFHHHDKNPASNFGNTSHVWDVIFGTYDPAYKKYEMPQTTKRTLINA